MSRRRVVIFGLLGVLIVAAGFGWVITREQLASGAGRKGDWRVVASWDFQYCIKYTYRNGEAGACGLAKPGTLNESDSWRVFRGETVYTLVAGPVPPGATHVKITPEDGQAVQAELAKVFGMTFYVAEIPGIKAIETIQALRDDGRAVQELEHASLPPPLVGNHHGTRS